MSYFRRFLLSLVIFSNSAADSVTCSSISWNFLMVSAISFRCCIAIVLSLFGSKYSSIIVCTAFERVLPERVENSSSLSIKSVGKRRLIVTLCMPVILHTLALQSNNPKNIAYPLLQSNKYCCTIGGGYADEVHNQLTCRA